MKKLFLFLVCCLGVAACTSDEPSYYYYSDTAGASYTYQSNTPAPLSGVLSGNPSYNQAESIFFNACTKTRWTIVNKGGNVIKINFNNKGYNFDALIKFNQNQYTIQFERANQYKGNLKNAYAVYKKYADKLNRTIQKYSAK